MDRVQVAQLVRADIRRRVAKGAAQYGEPLTTANGRDALWDTYEEAIDLCLYLRQAIEEHRAKETPRPPRSSGPARRRPRRGGGG